MDGYEKVGNFSPRTDLAIEISNALKLDRDDSYEIPGVEVKQKALEEGALAVTKVRILNTEGEKNMGKPIGDYITIESNGLKQNNPELHEKIISVLAEAIKSLLPEKNKTH